MSDPASGSGAPGPHTAPHHVNHPVIAVFTSHWLAMTGLGLVLTAIISWACLLPAQMRRGDNPYIGIGVIGIGVVLVIGLVLTPIGLFLGRRRLRARLAEIPATRRPWRRFFAFLLVTSLFNLVIASQLTIHAVHAMESRQFCGSCHVMTPESKAFSQGAHASLRCVDCHVGEGAVGFIKAKMGGARQLMMMLGGQNEKPIPSPLASGRMVPSEETCESCHNSRRQSGAHVRMIRSYGNDETNTPDTTLLTMNVGGDGMGGIHGAHYGSGVEIQFVASDPKRQDIPLVEYRNKTTGENRTYVKSGVDAATLAAAPRIKMQCFDCHNRPAHAFQLPGPAVDRAITLGRMSVSLPFLKKTAIEVLKAGYVSSEAAAQAIPAAVEAFYQKEQPQVAKERAADVKEAAAVIADIYAHNVFPEFGVDWGTYPDNRGHENSPGCFRCHDGEHSATGGETITKNCFRCHFPAAVNETKPELLELLGVDNLLKKLQKK
jgi:NapC/NirT cytochrome c family, N-terminal region